MTNYDWTLSGVNVSLWEVLADNTTALITSALSNGKGELPQQLAPVDMRLGLPIAQLKTSVTHHIVYLAH